MRSQSPELERLLHDPKVTESLERWFYDFRYPKMTPEDHARSRRERGIAE